MALINGPGPGGALFTREGRCTQRASIWSTQWPPISLAYLAVVAHQAGHTPRVWDCPAQGIDGPDLVRRLQAARPGLILLATSTPSFQHDMRQVERIRSGLPGARLGLFGVHATALDRSILQAHPEVDLIVRGEPEGPLAELLSLTPGCDLTGARGITWRRPRGEVVRNPDHPFIEDLDRLPFPRWEALELDRYRLPLGGRRFLCVTPLRGCPHRCSFCSAGPYYGRTVRRRSPESVVAEILHDRRRHGVRDIFMWAETFTLDREYTLALCRAMARDAPGTRWTCNSRVDTVDPELLGEMARAGCWMISFGLESADPEVLRRAGKESLAGLDMAAPVRQAREAGIRTLGHFVLGLPGETVTSMRRTAALARSLDLDFAQFYTAAPFVGTPLYEQAVRDGLLEAGDFSSVSQSSASLRLPGLRPAVVDRERARATRRFYLRAGQLARLVRLALDFK